MILQGHDFLFSIPLNPSPLPSTSKTLDSSPKKSFLLWVLGISYSMDMDGNDGVSNHPNSSKMFGRSASWSSSRSSDAGNGDGRTNFQNRRFNSRTRSSLLPPLSIARRSLDHWPNPGSDDIGEWPPTPTAPKNGERLKLDLSSIQRNPDNNGGLVKRDKIAFFDKQCSKVAQHVYLGGDSVARDRDILKHNGITHILNCVGFVCPEYFKGEFVYRTLWLHDSPSEDITSILYDVFDYFEEVREQGGRVFVHCCQGVSRSTSLVIAYFMWREGKSFDDAFQYVKAARSIADPNMGFACQLLQCQKRVHAFPLSPSSLLRMFRMAPHSRYDPLHLVPKMLTDPSLAALDSRGAFIVHIPTAIYVWIGKNCEAIMERDAIGAVGQIVRYERVQGQIIMINEGEEPSEFWDAFSKYLPMMDKSGSRLEDGGCQIWPGERKLSLYDVDFEVFQKAITGGFVPPFASSGVEHETHLPARENSWTSLRCKFCSPNMKEFVSAPKLSFSRVYSDSVLCYSSANTSPSSALSASSSSPSSSSSPPYLSPDSSFSDSSTHSKCLAEMSLDSPSAVSTSIPVSSSLSNSSNLSLHSTNGSSQPVSYSANIHDANLFSQPCSQTAASLPLRKQSTSLAERRGSSLSKSLKLPLMNDKAQVIIKPSTFPAGQEDYVIEIGNGHYLQQSSSMDQSGEFNNHFKDRVVSSIQQCRGTICPVVVDSVDYKESSLVRNCSEQWVDTSSRKDRKSTTSNGTDGSGLLQCNMTQTSVYHWPTLEKIVTFDASNLDSKAAFVMFAPSTQLHARSILYFWVGRSFNYDNSQVWLDSGRKADNSGAVDWNPIGCDVLERFSLPKDTIIKIVKENEEPQEFRALLRTL